MTNIFHGRGRGKGLLCLLLVLSLVLPLIPSASAVQAPTGRLKVILPKTNLRQTPGGTVIGTLELAQELDFFGQPTAMGGFNWLYVQHPESLAFGYVRSDCYEVLGGAGSTTAPSQTAAPSAPSSLARVTVTGANLRQAPGGVTVIGLLENSIVTILETPSDPVNGWYRVSYLNSVGYLSATQMRVLTLAEAAALGTQATPVPTAAPTGAAGTGMPAQTGYIKLTKSGVNLRRAPGGESMLQMPQNLVLPYFGAPVSALGYSWAYVLHPNGSAGYVRNDCYIFSDAQGNQAATLAPTAAPTAAPQPTLPPAEAGISGYITLIRGGVNLRIQPGGSSVAQIERGTTLPYYGFTQQGGFNWYYVFSATHGAGYIRSDMASLSDGSGLPTPAPVATATPVPQTGTVIGYVITTKSGVNLRRTPTTTGHVSTQVARNTVWPLINPVVNNQGYNWYFVKVNELTGYLRGDCVRQLTNDEVTAYLAGQNPGQTPAPVITPAPTDPTGISGHIQTTYTSVNIRLSPSLSATKLTQVPDAGAVFDITGTVNAGGTTWYRLIVDGQVAYMMARYAKLMTEAEYLAYINNQPTPTQPPVVTATPQPADLSNTAVTRMDRVLVRATASAAGKTLTVLYKEGTTVTLLGQTATADGYLWYQVSAGGVRGWIRSDVIRILTKQEAGQLNPTTPNPQAPQEASYPTLVRGSTGEAVTRLQNELVALGFLQPTAITGVYTTETVEAVKNYQEAADLFIDGIAGAKTQHKLYGTVPEGTYAPPPDGVTLYAVEKVDWYTGDIQSVWPNGSSAVLTDVKTGLSFTARRWAGGYHADVEPLTGADTAIMCRIYNVANAQEIADKNLYERRPVWVTVGGRSFAGSVYGVPHNYPEGDTIKNNDFNGQFCVHFVNSRTHSTARVDADHMAAIQYAYDRAPTRK